MGRKLEFGHIGQGKIPLGHPWQHRCIIGASNDLARPSCRNSHAQSFRAAERIEFRTQNVEDPAETNAFSLAWLAAPFIPRDIVETALGRLYQALEPSGWLVVGYFTIPDEPLSGALGRLQIVRSGGYPWRSPRSSRDALARIRAGGLCTGPGGR